MPTRQVYGLIRDANGEPWPEFTLAFTITPSTYTTDAHYPHKTVRATTGPDGTFSIELVTNVRYMLNLETAFVRNGTMTSYPEQSRDIELVVPDGETPIALETLRGLAPIDPEDPTVVGLIDSAVDSKVDYRLVNAGLINTLPELTGLALHLDAFTIALNDGDRMASWEALVGDDAVQATAGRQPQFVESGIMGKPSVLFDRTRGDALASTMTSSEVPGTLFLVARGRAGANQWLAEFSLGGVRDAYIAGATSTLGVRNTQTATGGFSYDTPHIVCITFGSTTAVRVDGNQTASVAVPSPPTGPPQLLTLGNRVALTSGLHGHIGEVLYYEGILPADDVADVETYLASKWGLTVGARDAWHVSTRNGNANYDGATPATPVPSITQALQDVVLRNTNDATIFMDAPVGHEDKLIGTIVASHGKTVRVVPTNPGHRWVVSGATSVNGGWESMGSGVYRKALVLSSAAGAQAFIERLRDADGQPTRIRSNNTATPTTPGSGQYGYSGGFYYLRLPNDEDPNNYRIEIATSGTLIAVTNGTKLHLDGGELFGSRSYLLAVGSASGGIAGTGSAYLRNMSGRISESGFATIGYATEIIAHNSQSLYATNDGWNHHGSAGHPAYMELNDCDGLWNDDEGVSPHDDSVLVINGGRYSFNGSSGLCAVTNSKTTITGGAEFAFNGRLTPALAGSGEGISVLENADASISYAWCHHNPRAGVYLDTTGTTNVGTSVRSGTAEGNGIEDVGA